MTRDSDQLAAMDAVAQATSQWVEGLVIAENLCPFAKTPAQHGRVAYRVTLTPHAARVAEELADLVLELRAADTATAETAILVHPFALLDFEDYNGFLDVAEGLLEALGLEREFQIASFHPQYRFEDAPGDDPANYSNRSPFPMLHVLRQSSVGAAVDAHPDAEAIPERNIAHLRSIGAAVLADRLQGLQNAAQSALAPVLGS